MPLTEFQRGVARLLAKNRTPQSHLAGGAALHFKPNSKRYSNAVDFFHDSVEWVAQAFASDRQALVDERYTLTVEMHQPGFVRALVSKLDESTKVEWAHDSAWRFMPPIVNPSVGYQLHPIDLATNKVLALAGRNEARDLLDVVEIHQEMLALGPLCWAAVGKDPGFTPLSLLELLRRRGRFRAEDFARLRTVEPVDVVELKKVWLHALDEAESFIGRTPPEDVGCLYYSPSDRAFVEPPPPSAERREIVCHFGRPGGVLPQLYDGDTLAARWKQE